MISLLAITALLFIISIGSIQGFSSSSSIRIARTKTRLTPISIHQPSLQLSAAPNDDDNNAKDDNQNQPQEEEDTAIDITVDPRLYRLRLPRATGIEWGTDLSFSFVYVRDMEPSGPAKLSRLIDKGDQICELRPVSKVSGDAVVPLIGASFDAVMNAYATLSNDVKKVDLVFFKGTKDELKDLCASTSSDADGDSTSDSSSNSNSNSSRGSKNGMVQITVIQNKGAKDEQIKVIETKEGANVRQTLVDNGINVYQSFTRWTNCKGKQLCGTCIVNVAEGSVDTNRKSMDEGSTLRENPDSYRLSCVTFAYGDVTVETFPPIEASQWTR